MTTLFYRNARLIVGDLDVTGLRFGFTIEKHLRGEPNTGKISVWNLSATHRQSLEGRTDGVPVQLEAGLGKDTFLLFRGLLDVALSERSNADWITNIYTDDGKDAVHARGKVSYRGGVNVKRIAQDLAKDLNVGVGNLIEALSDVSSLDDIGSRFEHGFTASNGSSKQLFKLLEDMGIEASVQDGEIQAMPLGRPVDPTAVLLTRATGLIGTPAVDRKGRLEARALLISGLTPGAAVKVDSPTAKGVWRIDAVTYVGDTASQDWYAEIEGKPLG